MTPTVLFLTGAFVLLVICVLLDSRSQKDFRDRFPPISDTEFLARCRPGTKPEIALKVRRIVSVSLGVDYERIYPSSSFVEDLGCD